MKQINKIMAALMAVILVFSLAACKSEKDTEKNTGKSNKTSQTGKTNDNGKTDDNADHDVPLTEADLAVPAETVEAPGATIDDIKEFAKENGAKSVTISNDGSVKVDMTDDEYNAMMEKLRTSILDQLEQIRQGSDMIESVQTGLDFDKYYIFVDKDAYYANPSVIDITSCCESAEVYQALDGKKTKEISIVLHIMDKENDTELVRKTYSVN